MKKIPGIMNDRAFRCVLTHVCFALFLLFVPFQSFALSEKHGGYYIDGSWADLIWDYSIEEGGAVITKVSTSLDTAHVLYGSYSPEQIPSRLGGFPVTKIGYGVFWCCYGARAINIPHTVKDIESAAF